MVKLGTWFQASFKLFFTMFDAKSWTSISPFFLENQMDFLTLITQNSYQEMSKANKQDVLICSVIISKFKDHV